MKISHFPKPVICLTICYFAISSCVSRKNIVYFQETQKAPENIYYNQDENLKIKPGDLLTIRVSAPEQEAAVPFNLTKSMASQMNMMGNVELETYMVSNQGTVEFPVLGTLEVRDLTAFELSQKIKENITEYVMDPIVNVRILNFKITVLGEVNSPGTFQIEDDHITLVQALGLAGDLTILGKRDNVLVMREENGKKINTYLDLTDAKVVSSPYFNLRQNDVVYVEPKLARRQSAGSTGIASTYLSLASVIASLIILITR